MKVKLDFSFSRSCTKKNEKRVVNDYDKVMIEICKNKFDKNLL